MRFTFMLDPPVSRDTYGSLTSLLPIEPSCRVLRRGNAKTSRYVPPGWVAGLEAIHDDRDKYTGSSTPPAAVQAFAASPGNEINEHAPVPLGRLHKAAEPSAGDFL